jgi:hypothetical protein
MLICKYTLIVNLHVNIALTLENGEKSGRIHIIVFVMEAIRFKYEGVGESTGWLYVRK